MKRSANQPVRKRQERKEGPRGSRRGAWLKPPSASCRPAGSLSLADSLPLVDSLPLADSLPFATLPPLADSLPFPFCAALFGTAQRGMRFAHADVSALPYFNQTANARIPV